MVIKIKGLCSCYKCKCGMCRCKYAITNSINCKFNFKNKSTIYACDYEKKVNNVSEKNRLLKFDFPKSSDQKIPCKLGGKTSYQVNLK